MSETEKSKREASYGGSYEVGDGVQLTIPYSFFGGGFDLEEVEAVLQSMQQDSLTMGPQVTAFQREFSDYVGSKYGFATSSCTTALDIATSVLGLEPDDEVITTPITFIATSLPVLRRGARPVFADIDPLTINIDPQSIAEKITDKTKAIYVVHYGGQCADMDPIMRLAAKHKLYVLEDAAHSPGAVYKGKKAGTIGDVACFSFHPLKNITTFEGGMITTNNDEFAQEIPILRCIGLKDFEDQEDYWLPYHYDVVEIKGALGNNYRMDEIRAAVGRVQLKKLDKFNAKRAEIGRRLNEKLKDIDEITTPYEAPYNDNHVYYLYLLLYHPEKAGGSKDDFIRILYREEGIQPIMHYLPNYLFSVYKERGYEKGLCPVAEKVFFDQIVNLPMHPRLTEEEEDTIVRGIKSALYKVKKL